MVTSNRPNGASEGNNLWRVTASIPFTGVPLEQATSRVDALIIGGGITGLRAAIALAESGRKVALVEAGDIGWGASGRSGGQVNPIMRLQSEKIAKLVGKAPAERLIRATIASADEVFRLVDQHKIDCDAVQKGWVQAAHCNSAARSLRLLAQDWRSFGADIQELNTSETERACGSHYYGFSLLHPYAGHIHPLKYVQGLAVVAQSKGVTIHTQALARSLKQESTGWTVEVGNSTFHASNILICTNAYRSGLHSRLDRSYIPLTPVQLATAVLDRDVYDSVLPEDRTIADTRRLIFYARKTADQRLVFGGLGRSIARQKDSRRISREATKIFPQLAGVKWEYSWGGHIAMTTDALPHIHELAPGVLAAVGCNGRGVAMGTVMGRVLSEMIDTPETEKDVPVIPVKKVPLQPILKNIIPTGMPLLGMLDGMDT